MIHRFRIQPPYPFLPRTFNEIHKPSRAGRPFSLQMRWGAFLAPVHGNKALAHHQSNLRLEKLAFRAFLTLQMMLWVIVAFFVWGLFFLSFSGSGENLLFPFTSEVFAECCLEKHAQPGHKQKTVCFWENRVLQLKQTPPSYYPYRHLGNLFNNFLV